MSSPCPADSRHWAFTLNNPTSAQCALIAKWSGNTGIREISVYKENELLEDKTFHLQGHISFKSVRTMRGVQDFFTAFAQDAKPHLEVARNVNASIKYTRKDGIMLVDNCGGIKQGKRSDLHTFIDTLQTDGIQSAIDENPAILMKYPGGVKAMQTHTAPRITEYKPCNVWVLWGSTGTGKSRRARAMDPNLYDITTPGKGRSLWMDGYAGQKTILFDDFTMDWGVSLAQLLKITDCYPLTMEVKGGTVHRNWDTVIFTTNIHPAHWYVDSPQMSKDALMRRIGGDNHIIEVVMEPEPSPPSPPPEEDPLELYHRYHPIYVPDSDDDMRDEFR